MWNEEQHVYSDFVLKYSGTVQGRNYLQSPRDYTEGISVFEL
jgi:hypothetical protein